MSNRVEVQVRNMQLTDKLRAHVEKKASKLDHYLPAIEEAHIQFTYHKSARNAADRHVVEITVRGKGMILRTEERADDAMAAFDAARDNMQRQIERYKGKHYRNIRASDRAADGEQDEPAPEDSAEVLPSMIVRRKRFRLLPMNVEEAVEQMRLLGHDNFFIFFNAETGKINVLYQRRDGSYGLIEAELD